MAAPPTLEDVLTNPKLWGPDFPVVLAYARNWGAAGETTLVIFSDRALGGTAHKKPDFAQRGLERLTRSLKAAPAVTKPQHRAYLSKAPQEVLRFKAEVTSLGEDRSYRVAWSAPSAKLLADSLTVKQVHEVLGRPEKITTQLIQGEGEARPTVLTLHAYAKNTIMFAESDLSPTQGAINRVILNIPATSNAMFREGQ
jgi:hypothetical protein